MEHWTRSPGQLLLTRWVTRTNPSSEPSPAVTPPGDALLPQQSVWLPFSPEQPAAGVRGSLLAAPS